MVCFYCFWLLLQILSSHIKEENRISFELKSWSEWYGKTEYYDIVINGNSRALYQYDPFILDSVLNTTSFNLGINGGAINRQIIKYKTFCKTHSEPSLIVQNIDFFTLHITTDFNYLFYPFWTDRQFVDMLDEWEHFSFQDKYLPVIRYCGEFWFFKEMMTSPKIPVNHGYAPRDEFWDGSNLEMMKEGGGITFDPDYRSIRIFCDFIEQIQTDGIEMVFVHAPIYKDVYDVVVNNPKDVYAVYDSIASIYSIPILDYTHAPICSDTAYFYNATHLNKIGAELYTKQLGSYLDSLGYSYVRL